MKIILFLFLMAGLQPCFGKIYIEKPRSRKTTAFAIITDNVTREKANTAIIAYRDALEKEGLSTYILSDKWENPEHVRQEIIRIYKRKPALEGVVFIGDVPIALIRNAQHMTTAFKMNEKTFPFLDSSVPSDRFYDDLDLQFDFICKDSVDDNRFYYRLKENSPQQLCPDFYSGRIRYPEDKGGDKYEAIASYLEKVVREKEKTNRLDCFVSYTGSGYNSECLNAWKDEGCALRESFPLAWENAMNSRILNFRMEDYMKFRLLDELQRPETDIMLFHEHGSPNCQFISDAPLPESYDEYIKAFKSEIFSTIAEEVENGRGKYQEVMEYFKEKYALSKDFFNDFFPDSLIRAGVEETAKCQITLKDLNIINTFPRVVILDACYNGSFHEKAYVAGYYIFNEGTTIAVQGNTRNVLQDRWTIEMIGLLAHGIRVGQWNRLNATLEGHIIGDPTFRFTPITNNTLGQNLVIRKDEAEIWEGYCDSQYADIRSLALRMLADIGQDAISRRLLDVFCSSESCNERLQALKLLSRYPGEDFSAAVQIGLQDAYEGVRRHAAMYAGKYGNPDLSTAVLNAYLNDKESHRVCWALSNALPLLDKENVNRIVHRMIDTLLYTKKTAILSGNQIKENLCGNIISELNSILDGNVAMGASVLERIKCANAPVAKRIAAIRQVRNNPFHQYVEDFIQVVKEKSNPLEIRIDMAEALGWFNLSYRKNFIRRELELFLEKETMPKELNKEIEQTINRLK